jgi:hypothetical protein
VINSKKEEGRFRATTEENAKDIAEKIVSKIKNSELKPDENGVYRFMIIAEQPYPNRMTKQVQRAFNEVIAEENLEIKLEVEGCGNAANTKNPSRINSELACLEFECFTEARLKNSNIIDKNPRDSRIIMFSKRDEYYDYLCICNSNKKSNNNNMV